MNMDELSLPPLVLAVAFIAVGLAAWLLGRHSSARTVRLPRDYYVGLDHLINDRFDRAAEVFARVAASEGDAAEIQFALGSLFRKRGEVDRAIAIHSRLRERGPASLRDQATFALALDYSSAGLMDRAERLFEELAASRTYRGDALEQLLRIYEQQGEWAQALKVFDDLPSELQAQRRSVAAHYLCELAEQAIVQGDIERARLLIRQARNHDETLPRAGMLSARLLESTGELRAAFDGYLGCLESAPELALEIIPRLLALAQRLAEPGVIEQLSARLARTGRLTSRQLAWLLATALPLDEAARLTHTVPELAEGGRIDAPSLGHLLTRIGAAGGRYQCAECGLLSGGWFWRCPKCRSWDGMRPAVFRWAERADEAARPS